MPSEVTEAMVEKLRILVQAVEDQRAKTQAVRDQGYSGHSLKMIAEQSLAGIAGQNIYEFVRDEILPALAARPAPAGSVEPAAWRFRHGGGSWDYQKDKPCGPSAHLFDMEPLYSAAAIAEREERIERERLSAQTIGDQLGAEIDRLTRERDEWRLRALSLQTHLRGAEVNTERLKKALTRILSRSRQHAQRRMTPDSGLWQANVDDARAALQQEGEDNG